MEEKKLSKRWWYWFTLAVAIIIVYKILDNFTEIGNWLSDFSNVIMPFVIGIIVSYILYIPARKIESIYSKCTKIKIIKKKARGLSVITVYVMATIILVVGITYILPILINSIADLISHLPDYYSNVQKAIQQLPEDSFLKSETITSALNNMGKSNIEEYINLQKITQYAQGALSFASGVFKFFVSIIVSAYILLERGKIIRFFKRTIYAMFNKTTYKNINMYFNRTNEIFLNFLGSQFLDAIVIGILTSIAMSILKVKYAVLLGVLIGLFNMIPYFGAIIAVIIATIITAITGGFSQALWMLITVTILQQIDANIINPKITGDSLKVSPLLVTFAVTIGGAYFNVLGMFLAVPVAALIKVLVEDFIKYKTCKKDLEKSSMDEIYSQE